MSAKNPIVYEMKSHKKQQSTGFDINKLKRAIVENTGRGKRFSRNSLSLEATAGKNRDLVRNLLNGKSKQPSFEATTGLIAAMRLDIAKFSALPASQGGPVYIEVSGAVEARVWREQAEWPQDQRYEVRALHSDHHGLERFGLVVVGHSMDKKFQPGTILDCLRLPFSRNSTIRPTPGQIVIAKQHNREGLCEMTCKRLDRDPNGQWYLMPESTHDKYQSRIPIGTPSAEYALDDDIVIFAIVSAATQQFL